jgi:hypothetical protein
MTGLALTAILTSLAGDPEVRFGFDGFPAEVRGEAGSIADIQGFATVSTPASDIPGTWCLVMTADEGEIFDVSISGLKVQTSRGERDLQTSPFFSVHKPFHGEDALVHKDDPSRRGAISVILAVGYPHTDIFLVPDVVHRVAFLTVKAAIPTPGETRDLVLRFEDGFCEPNQCVPAINSAQYRGKDLLPSEMTPCRILLRGQEAP